ncbi:MAG: metal ABC transporter permease [Firmicutes bacterium]|nr:metal ABC transporter permease [Bacillota bacterium]
MSSSATGWINWLVSPGIFTYSFMQNAWLSGTIIAIVCGVAGFFTMLRGSAFAAHALPKIGFAGAAGAVWLSVNPLWGLSVFAVGGALGIGWLGKGARRDVIIGLILAFGLGTGALFLSFNNEYAAGAIALLFGQIVGVSTGEVIDTAVLAALCLALLVVLYRPLLFASVAPDNAEARGVSLRSIDIWFLVVIGIATAVTVPIVGALLSFSLLVGPAAAASYLTHRPSHAMMLSVAIALLSLWIGVALAYDTGWPVGFFVATLVVIAYAVARITAQWRVSRLSRVAPAE